MTGNTWRRNEAPTIWRLSNGRDDSRRARSNGERREGSKGVKVSGEEKDKVVFKEDKVRSEKTECTEKAKDEREVCQEVLLSLAFQVDMLTCKGSSI